MGVLAAARLDESRLTRALFSYDASLYRVVPQAVAQPRDVAELADDLPLFASLKPKEEVVPVKSELAEFLEHLNPDDLTPREALEKLYELKNLSADKAA